VALAVGELVDPDAVEVVQAVIIDVVGDHPDGDRVVIAATAAHEQRSSRVMVVLSVRCASQATTSRRRVWTAPRPGPRHGLGPDPTAAAPGQPADLSTQQQPGDAEVQVPEVQVPPVADGAVIDGPGRPAARAGQPP
jgi:hypothetical protein